MQIRRRDLMKMTAGVAPLLVLRPGAAQAATDVHYWHHFTSQTEFDGLQEIMRLFEAKYPDLQVVQENIPNDEFMSKFTAAVVAGSPPDTTMITAPRLPDMVAMNGLVDLTSRINSWKLKDAFPANRWESVSIDGRLYGVPAFSFVDWGYYRKDWFEEAGISELPRTFEEFQEAAIKLTDPSRNRYGFGLRGGSGGHTWLITVIQAFGSPIVVDGEPAIDRAKLIDALRFYSDLYTKHNVVPPSAPNDSYRQVMEGFKTGQTGMIWHHTGSLTEIAGALSEEEFGTYVIPAGPAEHAVRITFAYNGLMQEQHADAAWNWVSFWGEPDPAIALLDATGYFPASSEVVKEPRIADNPIYQPAVETMGFGQLPPKFPGSDAWGRNVLLPEFQKILVGSSTVEAAADNVIKGLESTLR